MTQAKLILRQKKTYFTDGLPDSLLGFDGASLKVLFDSYNRMKNFSHRTVIEDLKLSLQSAIKLIKEKKRMENKQNL